jgi:hypothetical protein
LGDTQPQLRGAVEKFRDEIHRVNHRVVCLARLAAATVWRKTKGRGGGGGVRE